MTDKASSPPLRVVGAMLTDVGRRRSSNEDTVVFVAPAEGTPEAEVGFLALVADGMGGHAAGEVASGLAAEVVRRTAYASQGKPPETLEAAFANANRAILDYGVAHPETAGMGTTCTAILIRDNLLWLAHVGDSRAYLMRDGRLEQLSDDQTLHAQLIRDGLMTPEQAQTTSGGNILLQALGSREEFSPTVAENGRELRVGDLAFLCSDGLYNHVTDAEIAATLKAGDPQEACRQLVDKALDGGGYDNISVGVFRIVDAAPSQNDDQASTKPIRIAVDEDPDREPLPASTPARFEG